jgi:hypothetical protein
MPRHRRNPMNIRLNRLIERLVAFEVRQAGVWRARCPAHRDRVGQGALWIIGEGSRLVDVVCGRGCSRAAILQAIGWPAEALRRPRRAVRPREVTPLPVIPGPLPALGPVERAVLAALRQAGRDGLPRDQLPARLWGWSSVSKWRRGHGAMFTYPQVDRREYNTRQVSLTRALKSLRRKGCLMEGAGRYWRLTDTGRQMLNIAPAYAELFSSAPPVKLNSAPAPDKIFSMPDVSEGTNDVPRPPPPAHRPLDLSPDRSVAKPAYRFERRLELE